MVFVPAQKLSGYRVNLQSQSKLLGHCTVFLPSQCWSNRFANFTAINNIERERETSEKGKTAFLSKTVALETHAKMHVGHG